MTAGREPGKGKLRSPSDRARAHAMSSTMPVSAASVTAIGGKRRHMRARSEECTASAEGSSLGAFGPSFGSRATPSCHSKSRAPRQSCQKRLGSKKKAM